MITLLAVSAVCNIVFLWYIYRFTKWHNLFFDDTAVLFKNLENYRDHVDSLFEMHVYHGEPTIQALLEHSADISDEVGGFVLDNNTMFGYISDEEIEEIKEQRLESKEKRTESLGLLRNNGASANGQKAQK